MADDERGEGYVRNGTELQTSLPAAGVRAKAGQQAGLYQLLVASVRDYAIFALDRTGHILTWNEGARRLKGYEEDDIVGRHFSVFYPAADIAVGKPAFELEVADREERLEDEGWRLRKDGSRFWANVIITALRGPNGELVGFAKVTRDLTERRSTEEALRQSEQRFRILVQHVQDYAIFMLDPAGTVISWNDGAERIKGYSAAEILGSHFSVFYPEETRAAGRPAHALAMAVAEGHYTDEGWRLRKDGSRFWASVVVTPMRGDNGELLGFSKVTRDLTERRAAQERALTDARRVARMHAANHAKSEFLTALSHELRTPLNAIGGYTELLAMGVRGEINAEQRQDLDRIRASQQHLLVLINDLLNYSRIEAGRIAYDVEDFDLQSAARSVIPMVEPMAAAKQLELRPASCEANVVCRADRTKVEQILLNLLSNAVKFTSSGGIITVSCSTSLSYACLSVSDTGCGIPADKLETVFEPFVQLGRSLTTAHEGTGLGLSISRDMARGMGGDLIVESEFNAGSTFTLRLPLAA